ncbi:MAG: serpin family protein [Lachnospiraceae bacterium]|nr:serpin family protein [Lachnospiraceae bacterium]
MKKRFVMALMAMSMTLGACGQNGGTEPATTAEIPAAAEAQAEEPSAEPVETAEGSTETETTVIAKNAEETEPETVEEKVPYAGSGKAENLTDGIEKVSAPDAKITDAQTQALSQASMQLFAEAVKHEGKHPNVLLSPTSIAIAFGMAENGAQGETLKQMEQVIGGGIAIDEMNPLLYDLSDRFRSAKEVGWNVANSVWFKDDGMWQVKDTFAQKALSWYGADVWKAPFDNGTKDDINNWVSEQTRGMIPKLIDEIPEDAGMYLINAMAFEGEWQNEYEEDEILENRKFTNADGSQEDVTMLASTEGRYFTLGDGIGFVRDYKGGEYSFMGLLPEEGTDLDGYIASLAGSDADLAAAIRNCSYGDVIVQIPEFTTDYGVEMKEMLIDMGMDLPFDPVKAEFTEMMEPTDGGDYQVWIGAVLHKTHIEVDRKGTRAAAVTAIEMDRCNAIAPIEEEPIRIILDRPFIYGIIDNATGLPVFLGCVNSL